MSDWTRFKTVIPVVGPLCIYTSILTIFLVQFVHAFDIFFKHVFAAPLCMYARILIVDCGETPECSSVLTHLEPRNNYYPAARRPIFPLVLAIFRCV